jgi:CRP/FNR family transcriptional regulator, cyclic AMP receptor protein
MTVNKESILKNVELFSALSDEQLLLIQGLVVSKTFKKDSIIFHEEDENNLSLFLISSGEVSVFVTGMDGKETILTLLSVGDFFGEMSLIDGEPRSASVRVTKESTLLMIRRNDFLKLLHQFPSLALDLMAEMSKRLRRANKYISSLSNMSVHGRVAEALLKLAEERGQRVKAQGGQVVTIIRNKPTQQQLAEMAGTTRETVSRIMQNLKQRGLINVSSKEIIILQEEELKQ